MEPISYLNGTKFQESVLRRITSKFEPVLIDDSFFQQSMSFNSCMSFLEELKMGKIKNLTGVKDEGNQSQIQIDYCSLCNHLFSKNIQFKYDIITCVKNSTTLNAYNMKLLTKKPTEGSFTKVLGEFKIITTNQNEAKRYIGFWVLKQYFQNAIDALTITLSSQKVLPSNSAFESQIIATSVKSLQPAQTVKHLPRRSQYPSLLKEINGEEVSFHLHNFKKKQILGSDNDFSKGICNKEFSIVTPQLHQKLYGKGLILSHELVGENPPINYVLKCFDGTKEDDNLVLTVQMKTDNKISAKKVASLIYLECLYPNLLRDNGFPPEIIQKSDKDKTNFLGVIEKEYDCTLNPPKWCKYFLESHFSFESIPQDNPYFVKATRSTLVEKIKSFLSETLGIQISSKRIFSGEILSTKQSHNFSYLIHDRNRLGGNESKYYMVSIAVTGKDQQSAERCAFFRIVSDLYSDLSQCIVNILTSQGQNNTKSSEVKITKNATDESFKKSEASTTVGTTSSGLDRANISESSNRLKNSSEIKVIRSFQDQDKDKVSVQSLPPQQYIKTVGNFKDHNKVILSGNNNDDSDSLISSDSEEESFKKTESTPVSSASNVESSFFTLSEMSAKKNGLQNNLANQPPVSAISDAESSFTLSEISGINHGFQNQLAQKRQDSRGDLFQFNSQTQNDTISDFNVSQFASKNFAFSKEPRKKTTGSDSNMKSANEDFFNYLREKEQEVVNCALQDLGLVPDYFNFKLESCDINKSRITDIRTNDSVKKIISDEREYQKLKRYAKSKKLKKFFEILFIKKNFPLSPFGFKVGKIELKNLSILKTFIEFQGDDNACNFKLVFSCRDAITLKDEAEKKQLKKMVEHVTGLLFLRLVVKDAYRIWISSNQEPNSAQRNDDTQMEDCSSLKSVDWVQR